MTKEPFKSAWVYLALLVILTIPLCWGLFGHDLINGNDSMAGLVRALCMNKYMGHGQLLVRWAPEINWGYGYPMFNFYPPFFSFVSVMIFQVTQNMVLAINWACILFWVLSGVGMFLWAREFWGNEGGMLSAVLYIYAPYHILDLYARGAFAEFSSFAFFPFLLLSIMKMSRKGGLGAFLLGAASAFGLSLTHNIMSMLFFPVAAAYMLYLFFYENRSSWVLTAASALVIGLMMSSFFWLPAFSEKQYLNLSFLISMRYDFHKNFISLGELFWPFNKSSMDHVSFQVGVIYSLLCLGTLVCLPQILKINRKSGLGYVFILIVGAAAVFFTLPYSRLIWEHIGILSFIQFPWRFLTIIVFAMSFLGGSILLLIKNPAPRRISLIVIGSLAVFTSLASFPKLAFIGKEGIAAAQDLENYLALGEGEYSPKWITIPPAQGPDNKFEILRGSGQLGEEKSFNPVQYGTQFQGLGTSILCFRTFYFPGWRAFIDGKEVKIFPNAFGLMIFIVPPGEHAIQVFFGLTPVRIAGTIISCLGVILLLGIILWAKIYRKPKKALNASFK